MNERKIDAMRGLIIKYPDWEKYGIKPSFGQFDDLSQISVDWFESSDKIAQLALQFTGSNIIRSGSDPVWMEYVTGHKTITRQANFLLQLLQYSGTDDIRADNSEFLLDFIAWLDYMNVTRQIPAFGDDAQAERTWATNGGYLGEWEGIPASLYTVQIHKIYVTKYAPIFE